MQSHTHNLSTYTGAAGGFIPASTTNAGTLVTRTTESSGGGNAQNLQPYSVLCTIMKT